ncbi:hypothetical protein TNCV_4279401 [Trichonephila clavipes]|nr:hypothetical protein TNCV_4279401 [Trichonephila clavipes]
MIKFASSLCVNRSFKLVETLPLPGSQNCSHSVRLRSGCLDTRNGQLMLQTMAHFIDRISSKEVVGQSLNNPWPRVHNGWQIWRSYRLE